MSPFSRCGPGGAISQLDHAWWIPLDEDGHIITAGKSFLGFGPDAIPYDRWPWTMPVLLAISMMHCKNVKVVEARPTKKVLRRRHGFDVRYHTLCIDRMKETLRRDGHMAASGLKTALHICRGHFKDYRDGRGLFGKHQGLYWWEATVRGSEIAGIVLKDYEVRGGIGGNGR